MDIAKIDKRTERNVRIAMSHLVLNSPFYSVLLLQQELIYTVDIPTFATTGDTIFINPIYAKTITVEEIKGILVHELMHTIFMHLTRCGDRDHKLFNIAADYAINPILKKDGFKLPENHLDEKRFHEMSADQIYKILYKEQPEIPEELLDILSDPSLTSSQRTAKEQHAKINITKAITAAQGNVPGGIKALITEVLESKINWQEKLRQFVQVSLGNDESTWRRPNRNYLYQDIYLPSMEGKSIPSILIQIDTSGSIYSNQKLFTEFKSEIIKIIEDLVPEQVDIYYVDTKIQKHDTYEEGEIPIFNLIGGGGTDFTSFFKNIQGSTASCLISFTDMWASGMPTSSEECDIPILWCCYENKTPDTNVIGEIMLIDK